MASVPTPSHTGSPVTWATLTAMRAMTRPTWAPRSSSSTTGSSGFFERRMNVHQLTCGSLTFRDSTMAVRNENASRTMAHEEDARWRP